MSQLAPVGNENLYAEEWGDPIPVTPLDFYCASAFTGAHRCRGAVFAYFFDAAGNIVGNTAGPPATGENDGSALGGPALSGYKRIHGAGQAPATARTARLALRKYDTAAGQTSSYLFACRVMFEQVASAASTPGPWSPGPIGYSGDLDATKGAPAGTTVGGREAVATIASIDSAASAAVAASQAASASQLSANSALSRLQAIDSDGILARGEKSAVIVDWTGLNGGRAGILAQADTFGITTERTSFDDAVTALGNYLGSLSPAWSDTSQDTTIIPATFRANWNTAFQARQTLLNKIAEEAGKRATWAAVSGSGKPQDNATVGAVFGGPGVGNVSGQIAPATLAQYVAANTIHESASISLANALAQNVNSPTVSVTSAGAVLVLVIGGMTVGGEPNSSNTPTTGRMVLIVNGVAVGYSIQAVGQSGSSSTTMFAAVTSWSGSFAGVVSAYIYCHAMNGGQQVALTSGTTVSIISLKG